MAAGTSSRFVPLSAEFPKGLLPVKGEVLIERQIRQLKDAGIDDIIVVVGYMSESFAYLADKFGVNIVINEDYNKYNNTSSLIRVVDFLDNTFICSSDNYFSDNVFLHKSTVSYYSALYSSGITNEYCIIADDYDNITGVNVGGHDSWYMVGHVYFSSEFSKEFARLLKKEYEKEEVRLGYWEDLYIKFIADLPKMKILRYADSAINEFDTLDELRMFDQSYISDTKSRIIKFIAGRLNCMESELSGFQKEKSSGTHLCFSFKKGTESYRYDGSNESITAL